MLQSYTLYKLQFKILTLHCTESCREEQQTSEGEESSADTE